MLPTRPRSSARIGSFRPGARKRSGCTRRIVLPLRNRRFIGQVSRIEGRISGGCLSIANVSSAGLSNRAVSNVCNSFICLSSCDFSVLAARVPASSACCSWCFHETVSGPEDEYRLSVGMPRLLYVKAPAPAAPTLAFMDVDGLVAFVRFGMLHLFSPGELGFGDVKLGVLIGVAASMISWPAL